MLQGPLFARVSYMMFAVAVSLALLKLGGALDAEPPFLDTVPAEPIAKTSEPASGGGATRGGAPEIPGADDPAPRSAPRSPDHFAAGFAGAFAGGTIGKRAGKVGADAGDAPVFRRPSGGASSGGGPVCGDLGDLPKSSRVVFPLPGAYFGSYDDKWGAARPQGGHEGSDLMSLAGTPEFAITDGTIVPVKKTNENGWNRLGGYTIMLQAAYDVGPIEKGDLFYYAHMDEESALPAGTKVRAGERIGSVGDTGEGPEVTRGKFPSHLHLGWYDAGDRPNAASGAMDPYPLLRWLEKNGGTVSGGTDASYCEAPQGLVPEPDSPGETPDLDTGDREDPRPSPVVEEKEERPDASKGEDARAESEGTGPGKERSGKENGPRTAASGKSGSTPNGNRPPRPSDGNGPSRGATGDRPRPSVPKPSLPDRIRPVPSAPSLADAALREAKPAEDRDGRDAPNGERREKPAAAPTRDKSPGDHRPSPAPDDAEAGNASTPKKDPKEAGNRKPEEGDGSG